MKRGDTIVQLLLKSRYPSGHFAREVPHRDGESLKAWRRREAQYLARLTPIWLMHHHTQNPYFAWEAVCISAENSVVPPAWALKALAPGMRRHMSRPDGDLAVQMGLKHRGSGKTPPHKLYLQGCTLFSAMHMIWKRRPDEPVLSAARRARIKHKLTQRPETLARYFSRDWAPLFLEVYSTD